MRHTYDAIVIGTGQAGPSLAARLAGAGMKVAIVERGKVGGTCVNTGCIPTKTLVASAAVARAAQRASEFGVSIDGAVGVDMKKVKARKDQISGDARRGNEEWLRGLANVTFLAGHARFESPHRAARDQLAAMTRQQEHARERELLSGVQPVNRLDRIALLELAIELDDEVGGEPVRRFDSLEFELRHGIRASGES